MDFASPEVWRWIWVVLAMAFTIGEITVAGSFFLAPFAVGAFLAAVAAFAGASVTVEWVLFLAGSGLSFAGFRPLARRLDSRGPSSTTGAHRWVNREAVVIRDIGPGTGATGVIRLDREEWRAQSGTGDPIPAGSTVLVTRVDGTRLVVLPLDIPPPALPTEGVS